MYNEIETVVVYTVCVIQLNATNSVDGRPMNESHRTKTFVSSQRRITITMLSYDDYHY